MPHYAASYVPIIRSASVYRWNPNSRRRPATMECDAFELIARIEPGDELWLMMGSTNAAVALGAFRRGIAVHQISYPRAAPLLQQLGADQEEDDEDGEEEQGRRTKISPRQVLRLATESPDAFYPLHSRQAEVLEVSAAWQLVDDTMEARKAYANLARSRIQQRAVIYGIAGNQQISTTKELQDYLTLQLGTHEPGSSKKRKPDDHHMAALLERENQVRGQLETVCRNSSLFQYIFGPVEGVGAMLGSRFIAGIERIERFTESTHLSNYAGMLPRGRNGSMPSRMQAKGKGEPLSRSPLLNMSCFLLQDQLFGYGAHTDLGQMLHGKIQERCPCNKEMRDADKDLRKKHSGAVKTSRIWISRYFLEQVVWPRWTEYMHGHNGTATST